MWRIGIDATAIPSNRVGAGKYIFNLVDSLARIDGQNQYWVFAKAEHIREWNIRQSNFHFLESSAHVRPLRVAWEQSVLPMHARRYALDVLHSPHYTMPLFSGCGSVVTFCDMIFFLYPEVHTLLKRVLFRWMMRRSALRAERIIAISQSTANDVVRLLGVPSKKVLPVPLGVSDLYRPVRNRRMISAVCSRYGLDPYRYILYVGVLEPRKNIPRLLRAYALLVKTGRQERLVLVGRRGWNYEQIFRTIASLRLEGRVIFTDYVPEEDLPALYSAARVFVYPSLYEGFGLPILEAMSCSAPVVTSRVSSMPEIVGDAGILVDPEKEDEIAAAIRAILEDEALEGSLRQAGPARAAGFTWEQTATGTLAVYREACHNEAV